MGDQLSIYREREKLEAKTDRAKVSNLANGENVAIMFELYKSVSVAL